MSPSDRWARRLPDRWEALSTFRKQREGKKTAATVCATCARKGSTRETSDEQRAASGEQVYRIATVLREPRSPLAGLRAAAFGVRRLAAAFAPAPLHTSRSLLAARRY